MLERLAQLKAMYETQIRSGNAGAEPGSLGAKLIEAFPDLCRALVEAIDENRLLRGNAVVGAAASLPNASPLTFEGYMARADGDLFESLNEYASAKRLVIGDEFVITEAFCRDVGYRVHGGPTPHEPLRPFRFEPLSSIEQASEIRPASEPE